MEVLTLRVLSLFDGMSCGQIALERAGFWVQEYYASEVDKYAIQVTQDNYPDTVQLGDVQNVYGEFLPEIDLLIGGSPCQGFSFAGKQLAFDDPRSKLFFEFVRILDEVKPKYFLLENVPMKKEHLDIITDYLGVEPIRINSSLVSAQNRDRYYWTNIPNVSVPDDRSILLRDVLEDGSDTVGRIITRRLDPVTGRRNDYGDYKLVQRFEPRTDGKRGTITTVTKDNVVHLDGSKFTVMSGGTTQRFHRYGVKFVDEETEKSRTLSAGGYLKNGKQENYIKCTPDGSVIRKLTPVECERLQTVPDGYTSSVSDTQRYRMLGNGWTVDVIVHLFRGLKGEFF